MEFFPTWLDANATIGSNYTSFNSSESDNDTHHMNYCGNDKSPLLLSSLVMLLYFVVAVVGIVGNSLVIFVVLKFNKMKTVTNFYILQLAVADECFLIGIPFLIVTMHNGGWVFGEFVCKIYMFSQSITQFSSSIFLLIMSADRYIAANTIGRKSVDDEERSCIIKWPQSEDSSDSSSGFILYSFTMGFAIPLSLIMVFYYMVITKLKTIGPKNKSKEKKRSHRKVTHLVLTIITCYVVFWSPFWLMQIFLITTPPEHCKSNFELVVFVLVGCLAYSNSSINPFIYAFLSDNFKKSFLKACSCTAKHEINFKLQTDNSFFTSRINRNRNSGKRFASMVTKLNRIDKCNGNELANISTGLVDQETKDTDCDSPCNRRKVLQTDL